MKRLVYIISTFLILTGMYGENVGADSIFQFTHEGAGTSVGGRFSGSSMPDSHRQKYLGLLDFRKRYGWSVALAVAPNGWVLGLGFDVMGAKQWALKACKIYIKSNDCKIMDVDGKSAFIKQIGSCDSTSTASSSSSSSYYDKTWCAVKGWDMARYVRVSVCKSERNNGKSFCSEALAVAEHNRMKAASPTPTVPDKPKLARLTVKSNPTNANVYIDNVYKGRTVLTVEGSPGYYSVRVEKDGYNSFQQGVQLKNDADVWASLTKKEVVKPKPKPEPKPSASSTPRLAGTGTGFTVNNNHIVTAEHVVDNCRSVSVTHSHETYRARVIARDTRNDLGVLRIQGSISGTASLRGKSVRLGEKIATYGYPMFGTLSSSASTSEGVVNALAGIGNDTRTVRYDASSQPGNSGGPLLDRSGNVVGVIAHRYEEEADVNFAFKINIVENFLSSEGISFNQTVATQKLELADIAEKAEKFTVLVGCWE